MNENGYDYKNNNLFRNYVGQNKNINSFIPNTINRNTTLKSKFLNNYDNNMAFV